MFCIKKSCFLVIGVPKYEISTLYIINHANMCRTGKKVRHFQASLSIRVISRSKSKKCDFSHLNKKYTSDFLYFVVFYHNSSWQPSGVSWDTGKWIYLNRLENHILADFNVKNLTISKLPLLVNYLWPIPWWYTIGFISTLWTHGASLHFVKVVNFTLFKPKTWIALPRP